jgi:hypothetical protein
MSALHRFWLKVDRSSDPRGCWIWPNVDRRAGYGRISVDGSYIYTHRFAFLTFVGQIPEGYVVDHLCRNRACCNPDHLEAVTNRENTVRGLAPSVAAARHASVRRCPHGHPYDEENTYRDSLGRRACRACARRRSNGVTSLRLCRSCAKRNVGNRYPSSDALQSGVDGMAHRMFDGSQLCLLPESRKVWAP